MKKISTLAWLFTIVVITGILWNINVVSPALVSSYLTVKTGVLSARINGSTKNSPDKTIRLYQTRGNSYFANSDYGRAITDYSKVIEFDPRSTDAYFMRGEAYLKNLDFKKAAIDAEALLKFQMAIDRKIDAANLLTNACVKLKEQDRAIKAFNELLKISTENAKIYRYRGSSYGKFGDLDKAIADYSKAIELDPKNADFFYGRGVFYYRKNDYNKAIEDFNRSIELYPEKVSAFYNRGTTYYRMGNDDAAYSDFLRVMELRPVKSVFRMRILYKIAAIGISDLTGYRMDKGHRHRRNGRTVNEQIYLP